MIDFAVLLEEAIAAGEDNYTYDTLDKALKTALDSLADRNVIGLDDEHRLGGRALEIRVKQLFTEIGLDVRPGRPGHEDFILPPPGESLPNVPLVLEVKSSGKPQIGRDDLRQLDDWVYDLSQEEIARTQGLGGTVDSLAILTGGMMTQTHRHPSPHKGVLIVNAPLGTPFGKRLISPVAENDRDFVQKRNFCILPLPVLIKCTDAIMNSRFSIARLWHLIHETRGVLEFEQTVLLSGAAEPQTSAQ